MDEVDTMFFQSFIGLSGNVQILPIVMSSSLVYDSREKLTMAALESGADYLLWLDSDMVFEHDLLTRMLESIKGKDFVCGLYFKRRKPYNACLYKTIRLGLKPDESITEEYDNYPKDSVFEIDACGFGGVLMSAKLAKDVVEHFHTAFIPIPGYGEDISFCIRAKKMGYKLYCDSSIKLGHVCKSVISEDTFAQYRGVNNGN